MLKQKLLSLLKFVRQISGDDAYERYLVHRAECHINQETLSRGEFFKQEQDRKWDGIRRCC